MSNLYVSRMGKLLLVDRPGVQRWSSLIMALFSPNVNLIDRAGKVKAPFKFDIYPGLELPEFNPTFSASYEECCLRRATELAALAAGKGIPLTVLYSGGIDSTAILVSLMRVLSESDMRERVRVALNLDSISENPNFYYDYIRPRCTITSSENIGALFDGNNVVVGGEFNDQLFGSDVIGHMLARGVTFDEIKRPYSREFVTAYLLLRGMNEADANAWYDLMDDHIKSVAKCEVTNNHHFFWWLNFVFKWQLVYLRILLTVDLNYREALAAQLQAQNYHQFFGSEYFQQWSMNNQHLKLGDSWEAYKFEAKKFIVEFNGDDDYFRNKVKIGSLYKLFVQKPAAEAMTSGLQLISYDQFNPLDFYESANDFR